MSAGKNRNKQVRLDDETAARITELVTLTGLSESDVLRLALRAGLPKLESGEENPFSRDSLMNQTTRLTDGEPHEDLPLAAESPGKYRVESRRQGAA